VRYFILSHPVYLNYFTRAAAAQQQLGGPYVLLLFLIFNDFCQTNYPKIYRADLRQMFIVGRTMAVDDQSEISFFIPPGMLPRQPVYPQK